MKVGIFDSGLGGLIILKSIKQVLPKYDYVYLGDTKNLPYGNKSQEQIYRLTKKAVGYLFKQHCQIIIIACNTASVSALRKLQRGFLKQHYPNRRILGVVVPTVEAVAETKIRKVGIIGTVSTIKSKKYLREFKKMNSRFELLQQSSPSLVPLIEEGKMSQTKPELIKYLQPLQKNGIQGIILGCTHYSLVKKTVKLLVGSKVKVFSQDDIIPKKLKQYLKAHPEHDRLLTKSSDVKILVTKKTHQLKAQASKWFGKSTQLKLVNL